VEASTFQDSRHMKLLRLSALRTSGLYPTGSIPGTYYFCWSLSRPQDHSTAGRIMLMKFPVTIGYRTRGRPACRVVPESTAPPRAPVKSVWRGVLKWRSSALGALDRRTNVSRKLLGAWYREIVTVLLLGCTPGLLPIMLLI